MKIAFKGKQMTVTGNEFIRKGEYAFKLDVKKKPRAMDVGALDGPFKGKVVPAIYELDGNDLKICIPIREGRKRPSEFESFEGFHLGLFVLKRLK